MTQPATSIRVVVVDSGYASFAEEERVLGAMGARLEVFPGERHDRRGKIQFARGAPGVFVRWTEVDEEFLAALPGLRAVVRCGVGYDNVDLAAASRHGVRVSNVQGYASHSVSDHALAMILACVRGFRLGTDTSRLREGFTAPPMERIPELKDMALGIVGLGRIGGTLAAKGRHLFGRVLACDPYVPAEKFRSLGATSCDLAELFRESDIVSLHCNLTAETRLLIDAGALAKMRPGAILINTARGPVVDEDALLVALRDGRLHGAALDVFHDEPPLSNRDELLAHPRLIATGHYAWYSSASIRELQRRGAENMAALLRGETPEDCLNP